mgnify:CR=1 FL=1
MTTPQKSLLEIKKESTPTEFAQFLREKGSLYFWEKGGFWVVTDFRLAEEVLKSPVYSADRSAFFISRMPDMDLSLIKDFFEVVMKMMVMSDGKPHNARRKIASLGLTDALLESYKPMIQATVDRIIENCRKEKSFDFNSQMAEILPSTVLADLFEIPETDRKNFFKWSINMTQFFGGASAYQNADGIEVNQSALNLKNFFTDLVRKRKENPGKDFLSILVRHQKEFELTDDEIVSQAIMMLVAGQVTTTDQLGSNFLTFLKTEGVQDKLRNRPELLGTALEEFHRLDPAVTFIFRVIKEDTKLGNRELKKGEVVFISTHSVNRDPQVFEAANDCVLDRKYNPHFAFGHGAHFCLGAKLARIEMNLLFTSLLKDLPPLKLLSPPIHNHYSLAFSGFKQIQVSILD